MISATVPIGFIQQPSYSHLEFSRGKEPVPNKACTRLGVRAAFFELFLACAGSRCESESTLPPQAGNANR